MIKKWREFYHDLSYQTKLSILFYVLFLVVTLLLLFIGLFFIKMLSTEIYNNNQEKLSILSMNVENELNTIAKIPTEIHRNATIQNALEESINTELALSDLSSLQRKALKELNWIIADKPSVKSIELLNNKNERISGTTSHDQNFFDGKSLLSIVEESPRTANTGSWYFDKELKESVFVQTIFSTRGSSKMAPIGTVVISVNTMFIQNFLKESPVFSREDFFVLINGKSISSTNWDGQESFLPFIQTKEGQARRENKYEIGKINGSKFFIMSANARIGQNEITFYYFILNHLLVEQLVKAEIFIIITIIFVFSISIYFGKRYLQNLIDPINRLAKQMKKFNGEADLNDLKTISQSTSGPIRSDEIGVLYASFNKLIHQIEELVINDYQSKLLTKEMEYKFLQAQLDPHFLYNTLNSINWMALGKGETEISEMVTSLAFLFRNKLDNGDSFWSLREEMEVIQAYLNIQSNRFDTRLIFKSDIQDDAFRVRMPKLIIQPLIENAVKYGVEKVNRPVTILLKIVVQETTIKIAVSDDGPGFEKSKDSTNHSTGLGLENIRSRIQLVYGKKATLSIHSKAYDNTTVTILLPKEIEDRNIGISD
ncbi:sensor histidine kinase [Enterococcus casseliflavus]|uniref:sensor histidine kinase n=1 Tax=Enterococcus casseliflavus TaxID=37734 RepID=UPI001BCC7F7C|nr:histidine kinase [Enterococcus casseliflavus]